MDLGRRLGFGFNFCFGRGLVLGFGLSQVGLGGYCLGFGCGFDLSFGLGLSLG